MSDRPPNSPPFQIPFEERDEKIPPGRPTGRGEEKPEPFTLASLWLLKRRAYCPAGASLRTRREAGRGPGEAGWEQGCTSRLRKGVAAGEKLETLAPLGSRTVQHSHSAGEAPNTLLSLLAHGPLLSASGSRSCPRVPRPPEVTPTALIIFCFAPGLFSTTNFQQSPWRRAGGRGGGGGGGGSGCCSDPRPELQSSPG